MDVYTIMGYVGALAFVAYFLQHLFQTIVLKKKVKPGWFDMIFSIIVFLLIGIYVVSRKDYPLIILICGIVVWSILGSIDKFRK